ncbi:MAG: glycosyl hydrolase family 79 C-terminal domain-containing protein, partial [Bryobacteraceae bacterium]
LGTFLDATGWRLIWGLNMGSGSEREAVEEAEAVMAIAKHKLLAFEIGNEPDLFAAGTAHRAKGYSYENYLGEYRRYKAAIRRRLPNAPFAGPDAASATDWVSRFAADEGPDLKLLTHHYYRECANPSSTLDKLLRPDPKLAPLLKKLKTASASSHVPYRICETNSFCGGGKPGVSDTFGSALWVLDFLFTLASADAAGVNMETGVNQLGFISSYSPIGDDEHGGYSAKPEYYGMLAFARARRGQRLAVDYDPAGVNLTAYAVGSEDKLFVTIINKDASRDADVNAVYARHLGNPTVLRLRAPSLESKTEVTLGGSAETFSGKPGECQFRVPAASAAILILEPQNFS